MTLRKELLVAEATNKDVTAAFDAATRDFGQAYYRAAAVLAQGKAMLFAVGIKITDRKVTKRAKKKAPSIPSNSTESPAAPVLATLPVAA